jgi:hypothetical protein
MEKHRSTHFVFAFKALGRNDHWQRRTTWEKEIELLLNWWGRLINVEEKIRSVWGLKRGVVGKRWNLRRESVGDGGAVEVDAEVVLEHGVHWCDDTALDVAKEVDQLPEEREQRGRERR